MRTKKRYLPLALLLLLAAQLACFGQDTVPEKSSYDPGSDSGPVPTSSGEELGPPDPTTAPPVESGGESGLSWEIFFTNVERGDEVGPYTAEEGWDVVLVEAALFNRNQQPGLPESGWRQGWTIQSDAGYTYECGGGLVFDYLLLGRDVQPLPLPPGFGARVRITSRVPDNQAGLTLHMPASSILPEISFNLDRDLTDVIFPGELQAPYEETSLGESISLPTVADILFERVTKSFEDAVVNIWVWTAVTNLSGNNIPTADSLFEYYLIGDDGRRYFSNYMSGIDIGTPAFDDELDIPPGYTENRPIAFSIEQGVDDLKLVFFYDGELVAILDLPSVSSMSLFEGALTLVNHSDQRICGVHIAPSDQQRWGRNAILRAIEVNAEEHFLLQPGRYNLLAISCENHDNQDIRMDVDITAPYTWDIQELNPP